MQNFVTFLTTKRVLQVCFTVRLSAHFMRVCLFGSICRNDYFLYCPGVTPNLFLNTMLNCARLE